MARKNRHYTNPFLKATGSMLAHSASKLPKLQDAITLHQIGRLEQAESLYRKLLEIDPRNAAALHLLGAISYQTRKYQIAVDLIVHAIEINPNDASYHSNLGLVLQELKELNAAVACYDKAIALKPDFAEAYSNRGNALQELKQLHAAVASYDKAIELKSHYAEAYSNRGNALQELKQFDAAVADYEKAITLKPDYAEAYVNLGAALKVLKQLEAAVANYKKALALKPEDAEVYSNLGAALKELKQLDAAVASCDKAITLKPDFAPAYINRGTALQELKQFDASIADYDKAIALKPDFAEAHYNRGNAMQELKQFDAAVADYEKAITLKPDYEYLIGMQQHARMFTSDWQDFELIIQELNRKIQFNEKVSPCLPILALPIGLAEQRKVAETWSTDKYPYNPSLGLILKSVSKPKIRIGYYSAEFHAHPVSILSVGLFEHHDKSKFELIAFSFGPETQDEIRGRIKNAFDKFIDVSSMSDKGVAALSRELGVDIAIDLGGYTQNCRTGIFSFRAAPIQLSYIGYLGTMGAEYYDYLIADRTIIPVNSQKYYREKIVYLPTYQVNDSKQEIPHAALSREALNLPSSSFVYCCFNANFKITPSTFDGWMRILKAVPESVLLLYTDISTAAKNLKMEAEKRGVNPERLIFGEKLIRSQYLARCRSADLFLDTLPYNAGATASDALWAGLPVLTCMGDSFASRYAASMLFAIRLPELVTETQAEYEALAIELATNPLKLKSIKDKLENNRLTTPLFDTALFTKHIEAAYTKMYEQYLADLTPDHIYVDRNLNSQEMDFSN